MSTQQRQRTQPAAVRDGRIGRPPGPTRDRAERRAELLDAATQAIREIGADATMAELAAAAGITKPILYAHFGDKAGLGAALAGRVVETLGDTLMAGLASGSSAEERLRATVDSFVGFVVAEPELYRFLVAGGINDMELVTQIGNQITALLTSALAAAGSDTRAAEVWSYAIIGAVFVPAEWWLDRRVISRQQLVDDLCRLLWGGLGHSLPG